MFGLEQVGDLIFKSESPLVHNLEEMLKIQRPGVSRGSGFSLCKCSVLVSPHRLYGTVYLFKVLKPSVKLHHLLCATIL